MLGFFIVVMVGFGFQFEFRSYMLDLDGTGAMKTSSIRVCGSQINGTMEILDLVQCSIRTLEFHHDHLIHT